jgi:hypothetical protein
MAGIAFSSSSTFIVWFVATLTVTTGACNAIRPATCLATIWRPPWVSASVSASVSARITPSVTTSISTAVATSFAFALAPTYAPWLSAAGRHRQH